MLVVGVLALAPVLGACSGDDDDDAASEPATGSAEEYVAAITAVMRADALLGSSPEKNTECAAEGVVDAVGVDTLHELGDSPEEIREQHKLPDLAGQLDDDQADGVVDALLRCLDFGRVMGQQAAAATGREVTDAQVECINKKVEGNEEVREAIARAYTGDGGTDADTFDLDALVRECLPAETTGTGAGSASTTTP
jgi:hypothetical protein